MQHSIIGSIEDVEAELTAGAREVRTAPGLLRVLGAMYVWEMVRAAREAGVKVVVDAGGYAGDAMAARRVGFTEII
ncbi:hypothetical protein GC177_02140 [bacterium]|nr:hypothetical protein [bacterium]